MIKLFNWSKKKKDETPSLNSIQLKVNKVNTHSFFKAIRNNDLELVKRFIESNQEFLYSKRPTPPKRDANQSPLQVALKVGNYKIAQFLMRFDVDVNYMDPPLETGDWRMPVIQIAIRSTIFKANSLNPDKTLFKSGLNALKTIIEKGADVNAIDSLGNSCLNRAALDANQVLNRPYFKDDKTSIDQVKSVFQLLLTNGANVDYYNEKRSNLKETIISFKLEKFNLIP